jgi:6-phosphogluconolactonase
MGSATFAYVGCYTTKERNGRGEGISVYRIDPGSPEWRPVQLFTDLVNPSFLTLDRRGRFLFSAHGDASHALAFSIDEHTGELSLLNQQPTGGKNPVHVAVDPANRFLVVANYGTGTVGVLPINADGPASGPG